MNKLRLVMTKLHIRFARKGVFEKLETLSISDDYHVEVAKYSNEKDGFIGQATLWCTIVVNDKAYTSDTMLKYVVTHEHGHCKQWYSLLGYPIIIAVWIIGGFAILFGLFGLVFFWALSMSYLTAVFTLAWGIVFLVIGSSYSWFIEYKADSYAIKTLGLDQYLNAREEMKKLPKLSLMVRLIGRMTHPTPGIVFKIFQFFNNQSRL